MEKSVTLNVAVVVLDRAPLVPVTVRVELAAGVVPEVVTVMVAVPLPPVMVVGLKVAPAPAGKPKTPGVTVPVKPFNAVTVTV